MRENGNNRINLSKYKVVTSRLFIALTFYMVNLSSKQPVITNLTN